MNAAEASSSDPGNRRARLFTARGSALESHHALRQAIPWRYVTAREAEVPLRIARCISAILAGMTRSR